MKEKEQLHKAILKNGERIIVYIEDGKIIEYKTNMHIPIDTLPYGLMGLSKSYDAKEKK